jgi:FKBP-type peptidyl-prolyl cis-trans isomerase FkpA
LKKLIVLTTLCLSAFLFWGCVKNKSCDPNPPTSEAPQILAYASANSMTVASHPSGLFYEIINPGSGGAPNANSKIFITYQGKLLDGTMFDHQDVPNTSGWPLSGLIEGWRIGLPLIQKGGRIKLLIPSALGYGCEPYQTLPGSSILFFDITLVDVQ